MPIERLPMKRARVVQGTGVLTSIGHYWDAGATSAGSPARTATEIRPSRTSQGNTRNDFRALQRLAPVFGLKAKLWREADDLAVFDPSACQVAQSEGNCDSRPKIRLRRSAQCTHF